MEKKDVDKIKEIVAKDAGFSDEVVGTAWDYAMMLTYRTKQQRELYEEVIRRIANQSKD